MALPVTITGISTAVAPVGPFKVAAGNYTVAAIATGATGASVALSGTTNFQAQGQSFTNAASPLIIPSVVVGFDAHVGSPTGNVYAEITSTNYAGSVLATSASVAASSVASSSVTFTFSSPPTISASATFGVVIRRTVADASNYVQVASNFSGSAYAGGVPAAYNGSVWTAATADLGITVYGSSTIATDAYYFFGRDGTTATTLQAFKSTAPDTSWASVATKTGFTTAILNISAYPVGNVIHLLVQDGTMSSSVATKYVSFDAASDTFLASTETILAASALTGQATSGWGCSVVVRSNGQPVAFYNVLNTNTSGTPRARLSYSRRTGVNTWAAAVRVDANIARDNTGPLVVLGASDRLHFIFYDGVGNNQRHLTSANVLGTAAAIGSSAAVSSDVVAMDDGGTIRHVGFVGNTVYRFSSADNPTVSTSTIALGDATRGVDDNLIIYALYRSSTDSDLYIKSTSDDGATWGTAISAFVGTVTGADPTISKNQRAYQRSNNIVFPYIVNDSGTLKYNEYTVRSLGGVTYTDTITPSALPIAGADITGVFVGSVAYTDTIEASTLPIGGSTITALHSIKYAETIDPSSVPISGSTITPFYSVKYVDTLTAGAVPIAGATITPLYTANYTDTIAAGTLPIAGSTIVPIYSAGGVNYADTIAPSELPIGGATIAPFYSANTTTAISASTLPIGGATITPIYTARYTDTLTASTLPIGGAALVGVFARSDTLASSSVPIGGAALGDVYRRTDTIAASALPINGATIAPVYTANYADTIAAGVLPITGQTITPLFSAGGINYTDTIAASAVPIGGAALSDLIARKETIAASAVPITGLTLADVFARGDILVPSGVPIGGQPITPVFAAGAPTGKTWVKINGEWEETTTYVKVGDVWIHPVASFVKDGGVWKAIQ